jgi:hypothetical protein
MNKTERAYFAGLVTGEGCFQPRTFLIKLRADDKALLEKLKEQLGFGKLTFVKDPGDKRGRKNNPCVSLVVSKHADLMQISRLLRGQDLGKRSDVFCVWTELQKARKDKRLSKDRRGVIVSFLEREMKDCRLYNPAISAVELSTVTC